MVASLEKPPEITVDMCACSGSLKAHDEGPPGLAPATSHEAWGSSPQEGVNWGCESMDVFCPGPASLPAFHCKKCPGVLHAAWRDTNALAFGNSAAWELSEAWTGWALSSTKGLCEEMNLLLCEVLTELWHLVAGAMLMIVAANGAMTLEIGVNPCRTHRTRASATGGKN